MIGRSAFRWPVSRHTEWSLRRWVSRALDHVVGMPWDTGTPNAAKHLAGRRPRRPCLRGIAWRRENAVVAPGAELAGTFRRWG
jgi:hypothetical protein